jgi:threonine dehydratase
LITRNNELSKFRSLDNPTESTARSESLIAGVYRVSSAGSNWPPPPAPQKEDVETAQRIVARSEKATPLAFSEPLTRYFGRDVFTKLEFRSPVRSFKHRGALVAIDKIRSDPSVRVVVTASTGNHGQGVAYAASLFGLETIVYAPEGSAKEKLDAMRALGADVRIKGLHLAEAQEAAQDTTPSNGVYLEDGESPELMAGASSILTEVLDANTDLDTVIVPIGGGNLIAGSLLANQAHGFGPQIIGVQSTFASSATASWLAGSIVEAECSTFAGGLATTRPGKLALDVMTAFLETVVLVDDRDLYRAIGLALAATDITLEGAAAAPIAALDRFGDSIPGGRIGLVLTGSWASSAELQTAVRMRQHLDQ